MHAKQVDIKIAFDAVNNVGSQMSRILPEKGT